jgi:hypothetical protein
MTENDIAHLYNDIQLQATIEDCVKERNFWHSLMVEFASSDSYPYYNSQYYKYSGRVDDLMVLQKEKFGE